MSAYETLRAELKKSSRTWLVTGAAGFIGSNLVEHLLKLDQRVVGLDNFATGHRKNLNQLKDLVTASQWERFRFLDADLRVSHLCHEACTGVDYVLHQGALGSVPRSVADPVTSNEANVLGFLNIMLAARDAKVKRLVYASSSSVYGGNANLPFTEHQPVNHPVSLYAATKKANELMAHTYSHLYGLPATGLRFFTVYGPWGRPDMAPMLFAKAILAGEPIRVFNQGRMRRDFTYIDDIVSGVIACADKPATPNPDFEASLPDPATSWAPHRLFNIGNSEPVELLRFIDVLEQALGRRAIRDLQPMQPGDVEATAADTALLEAWVGFRPSTAIELGVERFARWYRAANAASPA